MIRQSPAERSSHPRLPTTARQDAIAELVNESEGLSVQELAPRFEVSPMTIRRDLDILDHQCRVRRVHGGAVPIPQLKLSHGQHHDTLLAQFDRLAIAHPRTGEQLLAEVVRILATYLPEDTQPPHRPHTGSIAPHSAPDRSFG